MQSRGNVEKLRAWSRKERKEKRRETEGKRTALYILELMESVSIGESQRENFSILDIAVAAAAETENTSLPTQISNS